MVATDQGLFLELVRLAIEAKYQIQERLIIDVNWNDIQALAEQQGLMAVVLDGISNLPLEMKPPKQVLLQWIGVVLQEEQQFAIQAKAAAEMAVLFKTNYIRTYVLKGAVIAECYPNPIHRSSSDLDCFLTVDKAELPVHNDAKDNSQADFMRGNFDAWDLGNSLIKAKGYEVSTSFYKNSTFFLPGLMVENHKYMVPFRGNKRLGVLELLLESYLKEDEGKDVIDGTFLCRPPVLVTALFMIEHSYSHFLHEGLTWRMVLDWVLFCEKNRHDIDWNSFDVLIDEFGFRAFYDSYFRLGKYMLGKLSESELNKNDQRMMEDVWAPLDIHESTEGIKGKLALVGNTWRARWKYHCFAPISMLHALWIQAKGVLFIKHPKL